VNPAVAVLIACHGTLASSEPGRHRVRGKDCVHLVIEGPESCNQLFSARM